MDWRFEDTNIWYVIIMQMLATKSRVDSTTQHNTTKHNSNSSKGGISGENVFPTTNSEGGIYLHVF